MNTRNTVAAIAALSLVAASASVSQATPSLRISDGINTPLLVTDNGVGDSSATLGQVNFLGTYNGWNILVTSGVTKPIIGSATAPAFDLNFQIQHASGALNTLTVAFSETDFTMPGGGNFVTSSGGTLGNFGSPSILVRSFYDLGNTSQAATSLVTSQNFTGQGAFSGNAAGGPIAGGSPISFTIKIDLTEASGGPIASGNIDTHSVPEGGSMVTFLGTALLALGFFAVRRKSVRA